MSLETVSNLADLVATNPAAGDLKNQGDDHIRNIKYALLHAFAGFTGAVVVTGVDGGAADAYTLTPANAVLAYTAKMLIEFTPTATNLTTTPTLNISGLGTKTIKSVANAALLAGDLVLGTPVLATYDGTSVRLLGPTKNYVDQLAFSAALPAQSLGFLSSTGAVASFTKNLTFGLNFAKAADVASATTPDIWSGNGNMCHITGTTALTGLAAAPQAGATRWLYFDGACLLTNGANFNIQGGANYTTAAGDIAYVYADTTTKFYVLIFRANGAATGVTPYLHVREQQTSGTNGGSSSAGVNVRTLNTTVSNSITGASLASSIVTLPAGTYEFRAEAPGSGAGAGQHRLSLYNDSDSTVILAGPNINSLSSSTVNVLAVCSGRFTLSASKNVKLTHYFTSAAATTGLGAAVSEASVSEVYASLQIWKVA